MRVAGDADVGQVQQSGIAAVAVDGVCELFCHGESRAPFVFADVVRADVDVVAVDQQDWDLGEFFEFAHRHAFGAGGEGGEFGVGDLGHVAVGEDEFRAARFPCDDAFDFVGL